MDMIERVAIAIRRNKFERTGRASVFDPGICTEAELGEARAAIEAMRDLTDEMFDAGAGSIYGFPRDKAEQWAKEDKFDGAGYQAQNAWQAMLTAALNSSPSKSNPSPKAASSTDIIQN